MTSSFVDSRRKSLAEIQRDTLRGSNGIHRIHYFGNPKFDASPAAQEIFINGVDGNRLFLPTNSLVMGEARFAAWNTTDNTVATAPHAMFEFLAVNTAGTVSLPTNLLLSSGGNPVVRAGQATVLGANIVAAADDTNKAVVIRYTGTASKDYLIRGYIDIVFCDGSAREFSNYQTATT